MDAAVIEVHGTRYRVAAVEGGDGVFRPDVREVAADGTVGRTVVDAATTDEEYEEARTCLLGAIARVL